MNNSKIVNQLAFITITSLFLFGCAREKEVLVEGIKELGEVQKTAASCIVKESVEQCQVKVNDLIDTQVEDHKSPFGMRPVLFADGEKVEIRLQFSDHVPDPLKNRIVSIQDLEGKSACQILNPGLGYEKYLSNCTKVLELKETQALGFNPVPGVKPYEGKTPPVIVSKK